MSSYYIFRRKKLANSPKTILSLGSAEISFVACEGKREFLRITVKNEAKQTKLAQFLADECESNSPRTWQAIITAAYPQGLAVEVPALQMKGFVGGDELENAFGGHWYFERHTQRWSCTGGRYILPGHMMQVVPCNVDIAARFVDFRPADGSEIES